MKKINLLLVYIISFLYLEFLYKILVYHSVFRISLINMILFIIAFSIVIYMITKLFNEKVNKILYLIFMFLICLWFGAEFVVKDYFDFYITLSTLQLADQVGEFASKGVMETVKRLPALIFLFAPFVLGCIFNKKISFKKIDGKKGMIYLGAFLVTISLYLLSLNIDKNANGSYDLYYNYNNPSLNIETFGIINAFEIDLERIIFGFDENVSTGGSSLKGDNKNDNAVVTYSYNNLDIDFQSKVDSSSGDIKKINEYMASSEGTLQNEYTGIFKGKNLILFMAESFNEIAVDKDRTPTLYKLVNSGFSFKNFYTPTIFSTIGGEFQELTGLYAQSTSILSKFRSGNNSFPQGIGNVFNNLNYDTYAYHNNSYQFQDRNKYLKSMGLSNFKACYNGLESLINCKEWPQSDVAMIENTVNDYIDKDNFMVFYSTVSGHATYSFNANAQAKKHKSEYESFGYTYSEHPAAYLAANMELDQALELLIKKLDEAGKLEGTVIALVGDHYPYELTIDEVNEVSSYKKDDVVTVNKSNFILWNSEMNTVKVDKVGSQIDVMPTIYNAFGIKYDSRLFMGRDILSTEGGLAIFGNASWVTDKGTYFASSRKFVPANGEEVSDDYVSEVNKIVNSKITMSKLIIDNNYYKDVLD